LGFGRYLFRSIGGDGPIGGDRGGGKRDFVYVASRTPDS